MKDPRDIILRPIVTEATTSMMEDGKYAFEVSLKANKVEVKKAVESIFGVTVEKVNTMRLLGKRKRQGRYVGMTRARKKAFVKLAPGSKKIEVFEA